ncbi:MAG: HAM1-like protein [Cyanobacteria bacterium RYN_339]|nr:HAM1-like protein [Cyanobacteria bacterium RYN_339]
MKIVLASTNAHKLEELAALLEGHDVELGPKLEVEETGVTFAENALLKAKAFLAATGKPALADDSGLAVAALGGRPGVYSARYAPTDAERIAKLLGELDGVADRAAAFVCAMALALPDGRVIAVEGRCEGLITDGPRGQGGFGYDPIFLVPGLGRTFAELTAEEKNRISHRALATEALKSQLLKLAPGLQ